MEPWDVPALFDLVRGAYPFRDLSAGGVRERPAAGLGPVPQPGTFRDLRARVAWDRIHNRLAALPGTAHLALVGGGTIPDTGQFPVYLGDGGPRLGELDEEFVFERRVGETFVLGNSTWRIDAIEPHRVVVSRAEGAAGRHAVLARRGAAALARAGRGGRRSSAARSPNGSTIPDCSRWLEA